MSLADHLTQRDAKPTTGALAGRSCLACGAVEPIAADESIWPPGWACPRCGAAVAMQDGVPMFAPEFADQVAGMDESAFAGLADIAPDHFWFAPRNALIVGLAQKYFPDARTYLEVGCGSGTVLRAVAAARAWDRLAGSELHASGLALARQATPAGIEFVQMDARHVPAKGAFDLTGAYDVIEHIADDEAVLRSLRGATRLGGGVIIAVPQHPWLWSRTDEVAFHERRYRRFELEDKMKRSGFEILFSSSYTSLLLPLMAASRMLGRGKQSADDPNAEVTLNKRFNGVLAALLRFEVGLTLKGLPWPAGGSRIVVGRAVEPAAKQRGWSLLR